uniref:BHLH domain-containing protein n=1 Tax=Romanomermis culicivorax TaxID=13658 RepID=A0A915HI44_ROMCU
MDYYDLCCLSSEGLQIFDDYCTSCNKANKSTINETHIDQLSAKKNTRKRKNDENGTNNYKEKAERSRQNERQRSYDINEAFQTLQNVIPHVPDGLRLPKVKTLRLAITYIDYLNEMLNNEHQYGGKKIRDDGKVEEQISGRKRIKLTNFAHIVQAEIQTRNSYTDRAKQLVQIVQRKSVLNLKDQKVNEKPIKYSIGSLEFQFNYKLFYNAKEDQKPDIRRRILNPKPSATTDISSHITSSILQTKFSQRCETSSNVRRIEDAPSGLSVSRAEAASVEY